MLRIVLAATLLAPGVLAAQSATGTALPNVFLDCQTRGCDSSHFRTEITFVNWVRDRTEADVHLLITSQSTGGGGEQFNLAMMGQRRFAGDSLRVVLASDQNATSAERRDALTNRIAQALLRYAINTRGADMVRIDVLDVGDSPAGADAQVSDPWNYWVFSTRLNASLDGQSREREREFELSVGADRVTELWKINIGVEATHEFEEFELRDRTVRSTVRDYEGSLLLVRAVAPLWSAGVRLNAGTSTFQNQDFYTRFATVLEYSIFPYEDFSRRELTVQYSLGARYFDYEELTVYDRLTEQRFDHELGVSLNLRQPWGSARFNVSGSHFLDNASRNNLSTSGNFNFRLFRGFTLDLSGFYSRVRDQIYIPKGDASDEEVLLRRRALETGYRYRTSIGLRYTFGSVFNNVVNPRID